MPISEQVSEEIVRRIRSVLEPDKVLLFGSAVRGEMTADSDLDLLIVERDTSNRSQEYLQLIQALWDLPYPVDLHFITTEWFEQSKDVRGGLAYPAHKYGKVIYEAA